LEGDQWLAIGKPGKLLQTGKTFTVAPDFSFEILEILPDGQRRVRFYADNADTDRLIEKYGNTPLPPYIKNSKSNPEDYQTVYSNQKGSVAAPTAGLHFTENLLLALEKKGVKIVFVTLHVGLGTFLPLKTTEVEKHHMHGEIFELSQSAADELQRARRERRRIIAVGTTSVRVLESCIDPVYGFRPKVGETSIYIYPGYKWKCVDCLITNFHLPQSTLILLTCSFGGTDFVLEAYQKAIRERYRFYSFGDAMIIL
jgi:S-adenosylmethionine:tRNA ribosyltransferase-isomerase